MIQLHTGKWQDIGIPECDHIITDPPYTAHVQANLLSHTKHKFTKKVEAGFEPLPDLSFVRHFVSKAQRWVIIFCALEQLGDYKNAAPEFHIRSGIYHKKRACPQFSGDRPGGSCEGLAIFHRKGKKRWNGGGKHAFYEAMPQNRAATGHPTAKPTDLMVQLVSLFTDPENLVVDPYMGTGSTGLACQQLGRRFIGIEMKEEYVCKAKERLCL